MGNTYSVLLALVWSVVFLATPAPLSSTTLPPSEFVTLSSAAIPQTALHASLPYDSLAAAEALVASASAPASGEETRRAPASAPSKKSAPVRSIPTGKIIPIQLRIPAVGIDAPIQGVGVNKEGEMDVPSGTSENVGWYKYGPVPGAAGSAVIDAHVFAAFAPLKNVRPGDDIYVYMSDGSRRHFVVSATQTFRLASLSPLQLFRPTSRADLNLITCAGSPTQGGTNYSHRLIVYSTLVRDQ